ncbi:MAG: polyphenol oxidase family protein [Actinobacteria bacterium]|nr:polyphenol oxidase family protein [Actinomycetota bacterium]MBU1492917.1 polyphenol oxidase family protein [Actinomycetota bacterium]MBU1866752.1 polyphenol oxidase family protein [Actinomycetota bacterium]
MIRPPGFRGAAFGSADDGNGRDDPKARAAISRRLDIPAGWAWLRQVHGDVVIRAEVPGSLGEGDAAFSTVASLPMTVATADCYPIVLEGDGVAGIAHAGWRGTAVGVVTALANAMAAAGSPAVRAAIGPGIGACCYEVGPEVAERFPGFGAVTTRGTGSIDLPGAIAAQLDGLEVWRSGICTHCGDGFRSYRRDGTALRQVAVAWVA